MDGLLNMLDWLYFDVLVPVFRGLAGILTLILITPLDRLHLPVWTQIGLMGLLTGVLSLWLRQFLRVDEKVRRFQELFAEKRRRQQDLQLIPDKYSRAALYELTDEELNSDFNTYLAHHYARYVTIYLLPIFLVLAWLNRVFSPGSGSGAGLVILFPTAPLGVRGLNVSTVFLLVYLLTLIMGFCLLRYRAQLRVNQGDRA